MAAEKNGAGVFQRIICEMPPHSVYIEAFLGSGAILRRKRPAAKSFAFELDRETIFEIAKHLPAEHFEPWDINAGWKSPADEMPGCGGTSIGFNRPRLPGEPYEGPTNLEIYNTDAFEALRTRFVASSFFWQANPPAETILYCDPPYPRSVRSDQRPLYNFELLETERHAELCDLLRAIPCRIILSGYDNDLYNSELKDWRKVAIPTVNRAGTKTIETLWINYPEPVDLYDYQHIGENHRDRWRFEKRLRNWQGQLEAMRPAERGAMLERLTAGIEAFNSPGRANDAKAAALIATRAAKFEKKQKASTTTPKKASPAVDRPLFQTK